MDSEIVLELKQLSKKYFIDISNSDRSIREKLVEMLGRKNQPNTNNSILALDNINLTIRRGNIIGVVGPNGSGKSTLLKIVSGVTIPSAGYVKYRGTISSILEIGAGFHPELTGRENIFLNCAILGMSRKRITGKIEEIIKFSEIGNFIDIPVKKYSSGMYVRLAFSILIHLDSEIMLIDEVLAVGDLGFQKKCINAILKMKNNAGNTIIFVSHNMEAIRSICEECLFLERGKLVDYGDTDDVLKRYLAYYSNEKKQNNISSKIESIEILNSQKEDTIKSGDKLAIKITLKDDCKKHKKCRIIIGIYNDYSQLLIRADSNDLETSSLSNNSIIFTTDPVNLYATSCYVNIALFFDGTMEERVVSIKRFDILGNNIGNFTDRPMLALHSSFR